LGESSELAIKEKEEEEEASAGSDLGLLAIPKTLHERCRDNLVSREARPAEILQDGNFGD